MKATTKSRLRTAFRVVAVATALAMLTVGGLIAANVLLRKAPPALLWTAEDLAPLPDPDSNGWEVLQVETARSRPRAPSHQLSSLTDLAVTRSADAAWDGVRTNRSAIVSFVADPANAKWHSAVALASSKPTFADGCPVSIEAECQLLPWFNLHKLTELAILDQALEGRWNKALADSTRLVKMDFALVASSRSLLAIMVSLSSCARVVDLVDVLLAGYRAEREEGELELVDDATVRALDAALGSLRVEQIDLQQPVIAEYLRSVDALALVRRSPGALTAGGPNLGPFAGFMLDYGSTLQMLNDHYRLLADYARSPSGGAPPTVKEQATGATWWVHNAVGKTLMDTMWMNDGPVIEKAAKQRAELMARRDATRAQVNATLNR